MNPVITHSFDLAIEEAIDLQVRLARSVITEDCLPDNIHLLAGVDVAYSKTENLYFAAVVVMDSRTQYIIEIATASGASNFSYVPGLFAFRELPAIQLALARLKSIPNLFLCDAHGIAHPRRFGLASHLGVIYDVAAIGCAKTPYFGHADPPEQDRGAIAHIFNGGEIIGAALRTQTGVKPVYVSSGHRISLPTAMDWVLRTCTKYRLPEPIRAANALANQCRRDFSKPKKPVSHGEKRLG